MDFKYELKKVFIMFIWLLSLQGVITGFAMSLSGKALAGVVILACSWYINSLAFKRIEVK